MNNASSEGEPPQPTFTASGGVAAAAPARPLRFERFERVKRRGRQYSTGEEIGNAVSHGVGAALPTGGLALLVAGGLSYTAGVAFYLLKRVPFMHMVWHLFVLGGSVCHVLAVLLFVY